MKFTTFQGDTTRIPDGLMLASVMSAARIAVGGGDANTDPATAALRQPRPTYPEKAGSTDENASLVVVVEISPVLSL